MKLPQKYIEIEDLVFALPDDFEGSCQDALALLLKYILKASSKSKDSEVIDADNVRGIARITRNPGSSVSMNYRFYEYNDETKKYEPKSRIESSKKDR